MYKHAKLVNVGLAVFMGVNGGLALFSAITAIGWLTLTTQTILDRSIETLTAVASFGFMFLFLRYAFREKNAQ